VSRKIKGSSITRGFEFSEGFPLDEETKDFLERFSAKILKQTNRHSDGDFYDVDSKRWTEQAFVLYWFFFQLGKQYDFKITKKYSGYKPSYYSGG